MIAVDTNVVVRLLTADHPGQTASAQALFSSGSVWIAKTVMLETAWVLKKLYGYRDAEVSAALTKLVGLPNVRIEDERTVIAALVLTDRGLDLADALHLTSRPLDTPFHSFEVKLVSRATRAGADRVLLAVKG